MTTPSTVLVEILETLSRETGVPVDVLRTFAGISDPANERMFTAESGCKAFAAVTAPGANGPLPSSPH